MELIEQKTKKIMEYCKEKAKKAGLQFDDNTLEFIVTNRDMIELGPKIGIPTMYDYWVHEVTILQETGKYKLQPHNPFETVINTRPAISYYNDNNPDWINVMIFYHVIAHIDFFQNNEFFKLTKKDFKGEALAYKRVIDKLKSEHGQMQVDYIIEFSRGLDNLVGYWDELTQSNFPHSLKPEDKIGFYFDIFLTRHKKINGLEFQKEIGRYNKCRVKFPDDNDRTDALFFREVAHKYPEFTKIYQKALEKKEDPEGKQDLLQYIAENSEFLNKKENKWIKSVLGIVRDTALYFRPQVIDTISNEGWATYWHQELFMKDKWLDSHGTAFSVLDSKITSFPEVGINPYALGVNLLRHIEEMANKGKLSYEFEKIANIEERKNYDKKTNKGKEMLFYIRKYYNDFNLVNEFLDQDFMDEHKLYVVGRKLNFQNGKIEYYIKSRVAEDYKKMIIDNLYHPPNIFIDHSKAVDGGLYLNHVFEGKPLVKNFINMTMIGVEYLWGNGVSLETSEVNQEHYENFLSEKYRESQENDWKIDVDELIEGLKFERVLYKMEGKKLTRTVLKGGD